MTQHKESSEEEEADEEGPLQQEPDVSLCAAFHLKVTNHTDLSDDCVFVHRVVCVLFFAVFRHTEFHGCSALLLFCVIVCS